TNLRISVISLKIQTKYLLSLNISNLRLIYHVFLVRHRLKKGGVFFMPHDLGIKNLTFLIEKI
ncbi:hypothetical protein, partial [Ornithobacterium rhinotracheale]